MKIALAQIDKDWNSPAANIARCKKMLDEAQVKGAELVVFPEMFTTGFSQLRGAEAVAAYESGLDFLKTEAVQRKLHLCGSIPDTSSDPEKPKNTLLFFGPHGELARYSKVFLFSYQGEDNNYQPGDKLVTVNVLGLRIALFICYDLRFPLPFYELAPQIDLYLVVANWPNTRQLHFESLLRARAIENQAYVAGVNRVGAAGNGLHYSGGSQLISPLGEILVKGDDKEALLVAEVDAAQVSKTRADFPFMLDRGKFKYDR